MSTTTKTPIFTNIAPIDFLNFSFANREYASQIQLDAVKTDNFCAVKAWICKNEVLDLFLFDNINVLFFYAFSNIY
jgi:hypothetical protein